MILGFEALTREISGLANEFKQNGPTLVHCTLGLNRSALVVALSLIMSGWSVNAAIDMLREKHHPQLLKNDTFVEFLHTQSRLS